jgi:hypothetical protein
VSALAAIGVGWWWRLLNVSLRHYLRLDRRNTWAIFWSTQTIGLLMLAILWTSWTPFARVLGGWITGLGL